MKKRILFAFLMLFNIQPPQGFLSTQWLLSPQWFFNAQPTHTQPAQNTHTQPTQWLLSPWLLNARPPQNIQPAQNTQNTQPPQWFLKPSFDSNKLYGFGVGVSIKDAKQNASIDLASSLQSSIEARFEKHTQRKEEEFLSSASQQFSVQTNTLDLLNLETTKAECNPDKCYIQIEIEKAELLKQLAHQIKESIKKITESTSPFDYPYKKNVIYPKMIRNYTLFNALGGSNLEIPDNIGEKPTFILSFTYDGDFKKSFRNILEKTIQNRITQFGKITPDSKWKILINISKENQSILLTIHATHDDEIVHSASVSDTEKSTTSPSFFAERLGIQAYKKIQKWSKFSKD